MEAAICDPGRPIYQPHVHSITFWTWNQQMQGANFWTIWEKRIRRAVEKEPHAHAINFGRELTECKGSICGLLANQSARGVTECTCGRPRVRGLAECTGSILGKTAMGKIFYLQTETTRGNLGYRM